MDSAITECPYCKGETKVTFDIEFGTTERYENECEHCGKILDVRVQIDIE